MSKVGNVFECSRSHLAPTPPRDSRTSVGKGAEITLIDAFSGEMLHVKIPVNLNKKQFRTSVKMSIRN